MLNNVALDVCIGLIFIFLLYSLLATIIQEIIAQWLSLRSRMLMKAVRNMLEDRKNGVADDPADHTVLAYLYSSLKRWWAAVAENWTRFKCPLDENTATKAFYKHPAIKYLSESSWNSKPAYIAPSSFSNTMMLLLRGDNYDGLVSQMSRIKETLFDRGAIDANGTSYRFDEETQKYLQQLYRDAQGDADRFRALLETWYNDTMDRVAGWYKRQTQFILFLIGLGIALIFNADTIAITNILAKDKVARENLVQLALNSQSRYDTLTQRMEAIRKEREAKEAAAKKEQDAKAAAERNAKGVPAPTPAPAPSQAPAPASQAPVGDTLPAAAVPPTPTGETPPPANPAPPAEQAQKREADAAPSKDTAFVAVADPKLKQALDITLSDIDNANHIIGLGWDYKDTSRSVRAIIDGLDNTGFSKEQRETIAQALLESKKNREDCKPRKFLQFHPLQKGGLYTIAGWILTAMAVSLGAPFWFDMLNKVIKLRAAGAKPAAGTDAANPASGLPASGQPGTTPAGTPTEQLKVTDRKG